MLSAGVKIQEKDFTLAVPNVSGTTGGIAGRFTNGPIGVPVLISSEQELYETFGGPTDVNYPEWFSAAEYLKYASGIYVVRAAASDVKTAYGKDDATQAPLLKNRDDFDYEFNKGTFSGEFGLWASRLPGVIGNSISIIATDAGNWDDFKSWAFLNQNKYGQDVAKLFSQPPKTSIWTEERLAKGSGAKVTVSTVADGVGTATIVSGGSGYVAGKSYIEFNGKGSGAAGTLTISDGVITAITLTSGGALYDTAPNVVITPLAGNTPTTNATATAVLTGGSVSSITLTSGGAGYESGAAISFTLTGATGAGAAAFIAPENIKDGVVTAVTIDSKGVGYGTATISANVYNSFANDEVHVLVLDTSGKISGAPGTVLERYEGLSKISDARTTNNEDNFYQSVINNQSNYIYWLKAPATGTAQDTVVSTGEATLAWNQKFADIAASLNSTKTFRVFKSVGSAFVPSPLFDGSDGTTITDGQIKSAYDTLVDTDLYNITCFPTGAFSTDVIKYVVEFVVAVRKDCMGFISPYSVAESSVATGSFVQLKDPASIINFKNVDIALADQYAQYAVMDTGWKYVFDKYNNRYRWVPLNGDIAGIVARMESISEPWFSPGGPDKGGIKNAIKLSYNPNQAARDALYPKGINPVVVLPGGGGTMLYGDRTMTSKPSAFDRINVRRLFSILEKAVSIMAKYKLFEINDGFTRSDFKSKVEGYLRTVQGRRGITEYLVQCDNTNNTGDVIDRNEFVASIYVKPSRSVNFVELSFVATSTGVSFNTVVGA